MADPLKQWRRDVTEEGIEPNPGPYPPSSASRLAGTCMNLNVGGCTNAFAALDMVNSLNNKPGVWGLAEVRASPSEQTALTKKASRMGYRTWWVPAAQGARQLGAPNWKGGLCVGVHEDIGCLLMATWQHEEGELIMLDFRHFHLMVAWRRPDCTREAFDSEVAFSAGHATASGCSFLALRDWNDEPHESLFASFLAPTDQGELVPSRWRGSRPMDWACTNDPCATFEACFLEPRLSNHKCLWLAGSFVFERVGHFVFSPTCHLVQPEGVTLAAWREAVASFFEGVQVEWELDVDVQWAQLAALVELSLKHALASLHGQTETDFRGCGSRDLRPKGSLAAVVPALRLSRSQAPTTTEGARLQRLASFLGRLHEAVRVQSRSAGETRALLEKIAVTWPTELAASSVEEAIPACEALIQRLRQQRRDHGLSSWRRKVAQGGRDTTRWLKNKAGLLAPALSWTVEAETSTSTTAAGSLELLVNFSGRSGIDPSLRTWMFNSLNCGMNIHLRKLPGQVTKARFVTGSFFNGRVPTLIPARVRTALRLRTWRICPLCFGPSLLGACSTGVKGTSSRQLGGRRGWSCCPRMTLLVLLRMFRG